MSTLSIHYNNLFFSPLGCTDLGGELKFLCQWVNEDQNVVPYTQAIASFPYLVFKYLESKLTITQDENSLSSELVKLTRSVKNWAIANGVSFKPKVKIDRNLKLEKELLKQPAANIIERRRTIHTPPTTLKRVTQVPLGIRGRKRNTMYLMTIGIRSNPDSRKLVQPNPVAGTSAQYVPAPRTYARASSTPLPPSTSTAAQPTLPTSNLIASPVELENTTFDSLDMDSSTMGCLYYSSSE